MLFSRFAFSQKESVTTEVFKPFVNIGPIDIQREDSGTFSYFFKRRPNDVIFWNTSSSTVNRSRGTLVFGIFLNTGQHFGTHHQHDTKTIQVKCVHNISFELNLSTLARFWSLILILFSWKKSFVVKVKGPYFKRSHMRTLTREQ